MTATTRHAARDILAFYAEAGVDTLVGETPIDRLAPDEAPPPVPALRRIAPETRPVTQHEPPPPLILPDAAAMAAREAARGAETLDALRAIVGAFEGCGLRRDATNLVFGEGDPHGRLMVVGEAPGKEEDIAGRPFVGPSGRLLDRMIASIGLERSAVYITNVIPWRPPGNRTPSPQETSVCLPFILRQIELVDPDVLVCLGGASAQTLLNVRDGILRTRGRWFTHATGTRDIRAIATLHPAYLLRQPLQKRLAWRDLLTIQRALAETAK